MGLIFILISDFNRLSWGILKMRKEAKINERYKLARGSRNGNLKMALRIGRMWSRRVARDFRERDRNLPNFRISRFKIRGAPFSGWPNGYVGVCLGPSKTTGPATSHCWYTRKAT